MKQSSGKRNADNRIQKSIRTHNQPYEPTGVDRDILELVYRWHYVTAEQIRRYRGQSDNSLHDIQRRLKLLVEHDYLYPARLWRDTPAGRVPFVYTLDTNGIKLLHECGLEAKRYFRKDRKHNPLQFPHNLTINEVALAAIQLPASEPRIHLSKVLHDWELKREQYQVTLYRDTYTTRSTEEVTMTPDLWLDFRITRQRQTFQVCMFVEVDMGTHTSKERFQKKIASYVEFINSGQYRQRFFTTSVLIAYLTPKGDNRRDEMKFLCEQQLANNPMWRPQYYTFGHAATGTGDAGLFLFGSIPPGALNPTDTFLSSFCLAPFDSTPQPLVEI